jgi:hypothetical protein
MRTELRDGGKLWNARKRLIDDDVIFLNTTMLERFPELCLF